MLFSNVAPQTFNCLDTPDRFALIATEDEQFDFSNSDTLEFTWGPKQFIQELFTEVTQHLLLRFPEDNIFEADSGCIALALYEIGEQAVIIYYDLEWTTDFEVWHYISAYELKQYVDNVEIVEVRDTNPENIKKESEELYNLLEPRLAKISPKN